MSCGGGGGFGGSGANRYYGVFCDTTQQTASLITAAYPMRFNTTEASDGVYIVSGSRMTVANTGVYNIQFSAQMDKIAGGGAPVNIDIWLAYTGSNVPRSNTRMTINGSQSKHVPAWNFVLPITANDYVQIMWRTDDINGVLYYEGASSNPDRPEIPSVIATVTQVG